MIFVGAYLIATAVPQSENHKHASRLDRTIQPYDSDLRRILLLRGLDGDFFGFCWYFGVFTLLYAGTALCCFRSVRQLWPVGHFAFYTVAAIAGMNIDARLDEMSRMLYMFIPGAVAGIVASGCVAIWARNFVLR